MLSDDDILAMLVYVVPDKEISMSKKVINWLKCFSNAFLDANFQLNDQKEYFGKEVINTMILPHNNQLYKLGMEYCDNVINFDLDFRIKLDLGTDNLLSYGILNKYGHPPLLHSKAEIYMKGMLQFIIEDILESAGCGDTKKITMRHVRKVISNDKCLRGLVRCINSDI